MCAEFWSDNVQPSNAFSPILSVLMPPVRKSEGNADLFSYNSQRNGLWGTGVYVQVYHQDIGDILPDFL